MHNEHRCEVALSDLQPGLVLSESVNDDSGTLLLAARQAITADMLRQLQLRGVTTLSLHAQDAQRVAGRSGKVQGRALSDSHGQASKPFSDLNKPLRDQLPDRRGQEYCPRRNSQLQSLVQQAMVTLKVLSKSVQMDSDAAGAALKDVSEKLTNLLVDDVDQTLAFLLLPAVREFDLSKRIAELAALSMAISIELEMPAVATIEIGWAAMLHDLSLFRSSPRVRSPATTLTAQEWLLYQQHPLDSQALIQSLDIPQAVRLAVAQVHEQLDGTGYPLQLSGPRIHPYANILNVADAYLRIIGPGPGRPPVVPHDAMGVLLSPPRSGLFAPHVLLALFRVLTLFPLGSVVLLSDGSQGRVVRRPQSGFARPVVRIDPPDSSKSMGRIVDLETSELQILSPVCDAQLGQLRLSTKMMSTTPWHPSNF